MATVAWGVLAFGAVYPWAYRALAAGSVVVGAAGFFAGRRGRPPLTRLAVALGCVAVAIGLQLVPMPRPLLARINPGTDAFLRRYDFAYATGTPSADSVPSQMDDVARPWQTISIAPYKTRLGLGLFLALALLLLGTARIVSIVGARGVALAVMGLGIVVTLLAMLQLALNPNAGEFTLIYGFWRPRGISEPFGPFVNPNHYAGWMLMTVPLVLGLACGTFERAGRMLAPGLRNQVLWLASMDGSVLATSAFACVAMGASLMMTKSRSGIASLIVAMALVGALVLLRQRRARARVAAAAAFVALLVGTTAWAGIDTMLYKFRQPTDGVVGLSGRVGAWRDAVQMVRDSPLAGLGLDTYGTAMVVYQTGPRGMHFQEAHNDYLQLAAEGGLLVGVPALAALLVFVAEVRRRFAEAPREGMTYWLRVGAVVGLVAVALQSLVEFSLQMPGNAAMFALLAAIALHRSPRLAGRLS
ncbi:MAG: O-antigen ligase family protein [Acidobacteriota bacterium]